MKFFRGLVRIGILFGLIGLVVWLYLDTLEPRHDREWQPFYAVLPDATVTTDTVMLHQVRDWRHTATTTYDRTYIATTTIAQDELEQVWFTVQPFAKFAGVGHTLLTFELTDGRAYTFSIEARREAGEEYTALQGLFNQYELIYAWGTARDFLGVRLFFLGDDLYHYPLTLTDAEAWTLLTRVADATATVADQPRFYNTLRANCTNLLAKSINERSDETPLPYGLAWNFPGYSDRYLQTHGYLDSSYDIDMIRSGYGLAGYERTLFTAAQADDPAVFTTTLASTSRAVLNK